MGYFHDKVLKSYPVLDERVKYLGTGTGYVPIHMLALKNTETRALGNPETVSPALREVVRYGAELGRKDLENRYDPETKADWKKLSGTRNYIFVTDSSREAKIAAMYSGGLQKIAESRCREYEVEEYWQDDDEPSDDDLQGLKIGSVSLAGIGGKRDEKNSAGEGTDVYARTILEIHACLDNLKTQYLYFEGLDDEQNIVQKTEVLKAFSDQVRLIRVSPSVFHSPAVQELVMLDGDHTMVFHMDKTGSDHFIQVCRNLLEGEKTAFSTDEELSAAVMRMMKTAGRTFSEEWIGCYLDRGADGDHIDAEKMFRESRWDDDKTALGQLDQMPGLHNVKTVIREMMALAAEESRNPLLKLHRNAIFAGDPGTGKSVAADLIANALAEQGVTAPIMVSPSRDQLIGRYVGHTAPLIEKAFASARGGVLFVDEAGFFLNDNGKGYCTEAIKEFVRYMELYPDVTVIFAMYTSEVEDFLKLDDGLRSRISRIVKFEDYTVSELCDITAYMLSENGYELSGGRKLLEACFKEARLGENFGNARFARKLTEAIILSRCLKNDNADGDQKKITEDMVAQGIARMKKEVAEHRTGMGFLGNVRKSERGEECLKLVNP